MEYYIIDNKIIGFEAELDAKLYTYPKLTTEQKAFYEQNKCTLYEVRNLKLNDVKRPTLDDLKESKIQYFSSHSFEQREQVLPEYKLVNAGLGIYDDAEVLRITGIVQKYREEFYRCKLAVEQAETEEELNSIEYRVVE